jgi:hypothetical protein
MIGWVSASASSLSTGATCGGLAVSICGGGTTALGLMATAVKAVGHLLSCDRRSSCQKARI